MSGIFQFLVAAGLGACIFWCGWWWGSLFTMRRYGPKIDKLTVQQKMIDWKLAELRKGKDEN